MEEQRQFDFISSFPGHGIPMQGYVHESAGLCPRNCQSRIIAFQQGTINQKGKEEESTTVG